VEQAFQNVQELSNPWSLAMLLKLKHNAS
jgi:hypothetical protein